LAEKPPEVSRWGLFVENCIITSFYRNLSFISLRCPIKEAFTVCEWLSKNTLYGGDVYWLIPDRLFCWDDFIVNQNPDYPVYISMKAFGSPLRGVNTVFFRTFWFTMYVTGPIVDSMLAKLGAFLKSTILRR